MKDPMGLPDEPQLPMTGSGVKKPAQAPDPAAALQDLYRIPARPSTLAAEAKPQRRRLGPAMGRRRL